MKTQATPPVRRLVLIDDDPTYRAIVLRAAQQQGIEMHAFESLLDLDDAGVPQKYDAAIVDYDLGNSNGVEIVEYLSALFGDIPMVLVSESARKPGKKGWPKNIKMFVSKSDGFERVLHVAKEFADLSVTRH